MRPGSLVPRFRKCGKSSCHCAKEGAKGHGPSFSLTHSVDGKTITHVIPAGPAVDRTREQLEEYHRFRQLVQELISVSERICDHQLRQTEPGIDSVKKTRSPPFSPLRSWATSNCSWAARAATNWTWKLWKQPSAARRFTWRRKPYSSGGTPITPMATRSRLATVGN